MAYAAVALTVNVVLAAYGTHRQMLSASKVDHCLGCNTVLPQQFGIPYLWLNTQHLTCAAAAGILFHTEAL